jgi:hypothetical protein
MATKLKLRAEDEEDLSVVSACLQDAIVARVDMAWLKDEGRFALVVSRFCWECCPEEGPRERVHTGISFDRVTAVRHRGLPEAERDRMLSLLAIRRIDGGIHLDFAGGGTIRLEADRIMCHLQDLDEPWPTSWRPSHPLEDR